MGAVKRVIEQYAHAQAVSFEAAMNSGVSIDEMKGAVETHNNFHIELSRVVPQLNSDQLQALINLANGMIWSGETEKLVLQLAAQIEELLAQWYKESSEELGATAQSTSIGS